MRVADGEADARVGVGRADERGRVDASGPERVARAAAEDHVRFSPFGSGSSPFRRTRPFTSATSSNPARIACAIEKP